MQNDTIAAIATPPGIGGIGVIRVSGPGAFATVQPLLRQASGRTDLPQSHLLTYGHIIDPTTGEIFDEVLVTFMRAPRTYTREDVAEIQGHGGPLILQRMLHLILAQGVRLARPGEFTMRAFLNGRLDLAQAEAVMDLIHAQTEAGLRLAMQQFRGRVSEQVQEARHNIQGAVARIEASIDFPEEDVPTPRPEELCPLVVAAQRQVDALLAGSEQGQLYRQGLRTAIIGRPNVGKSSLLNALLRSERAIVTPIAGTTRDTVEEVANLYGIPLHLIDTAGITPTDDPIEQIGVRRSRAAAESADMVLLVFDGAEKLTGQDYLVSRELQAMGFGIGELASTIGAKNVGARVVGEGGVDLCGTLSGGQVSPGMHIVLGAGSLQVLVPLAPGLISWVGIRGHRQLAMDDVVRFQPEAGTVALDGEREIELSTISVVEVCLCADGPYVVNVTAALEAAAHAGRLHRVQVD